MRRGTRNSDRRRNTRRVVHAIVTADVLKLVNGQNLIRIRITRLKKSPFRLTRLGTFRFTALKTFGLTDHWTFGLTFGTFGLRRCWNRGLNTNGGW